MIKKKKKKMKSNLTVPVNEKNKICFQFCLEGKKSFDNNTEPELSK